MKRGRDSGDDDDDDNEAVMLQCFRKNKSTRREAGGGLVGRLFEKCVPKKKTVGCLETCPIPVSQGRERACGVEHVTERVSKGLMAL